MHSEAVMEWVERFTGNVVIVRTGRPKLSWFRDTLGGSDRASLQMLLDSVINRGLTCTWCKGTYASVQPHRHTYGRYRHMVANMDVSDSRCRWIGKIIARGLRLVASRLYRMSVTRPWVMCRRYSIHLFRRRPAGLHTLYKRKGKEWKESIIQSCHIRTHTNSDVPLQIGTVR